MNASTRTSLTVLASGLALGAGGDALLRATPWGLGLTLWIGALAALVWQLHRRLSATPPAPVRALLALVLLFALCFAWRDSATLRALDLLALLLVLSVLAGRARPAALLTAGVGDYLRGLTRLTFFDVAFGSGFLLRRDIAWATLPRGGWERPALAAVRGVLLAVPLLLVFGGLLAGADPVFSHFVGLAFRWDLGALGSHLGLSLLWAWLAGGLLRALRPALDAPPPTLPPAPRRLTIGRVETALALGLLNLLFLAFVLVQCRAFFGGQAFVQATAGLSYAQYARQGFFQLVWVAALVLPLLLAFHTAQPSDDPLAQRLYRALAAAQVVLLGVIMASALQRMALYQAEYGQTELRFYTSAFMVWLGMVFVWFAATVLRGHRRFFAGGALASALVAVLVLHAVNPDEAIVRANLARAQAGRPFDAAYATGLSLDAVPALADALPHLPLSTQAVVLRDFDTRRFALAPQDLRSWSLSRALAWRAMGTHF